MNGKYATKKVKKVLSKRKKTAQKTVRKVVKKK